MKNKKQNVKNARRKTKNVQWIMKNENKKGKQKQKNKMENKNKTRETNDEKLKIWN